MLRQLLAVLLGLFVFAAPALAQEARPAFAVGQVWTLSDPSQPTGRVLIGKIDGDTIHIRISGINAPDLPNFRSEAFGIGHAPITKDALDESVKDVVSDDAAIPDSFENGYETWRKAKGGVFAITVPEIVDSVRDTLRPDN